MDAADPKQVQSRQPSRAPDNTWARVNKRNTVKHEAIRGDMLRGRTISSEQLGSDDPLASSELSSLTITFLAKPEVFALFAERVSAMLETDFFEHSWETSQWTDLDGAPFGAKARREARSRASTLFQEYSHAGARRLTDSEIDTIREARASGTG